MGNLHQLVKQNRKSRNKHLKNKKATPTPTAPVSRKKAPSKHLPPEMREDFTSPESPEEQDLASIVEAAYESAEALVAYPTKDAETSPSLESGAAGAAQVATPMDRDASKFRRPRVLPRPSTPVRQFAVQPKQESSDDMLGTGVVNIVMPSDLLTKFKRANSQQIPLREYIVNRLRQCQDHDGSGFYIPESVKTEIEHIGGVNFDTAADLLTWVRKITRIRLNNSFELHISTDHIDRALHRKDPDQTESECFSEYLEAGIEIKTGMR